MKKGLVAILMPRDGALQILLDTNVWLDYFLMTRPESALVKDLIGYAKRKGVELLCSAHSVCDIFYMINVSQKRDLRADGQSVTPQRAGAINEFAWGCVDALQELAMPVPCDMRVLWLARKLKPLQPDFEDALILGACELSGADFLVTNDQSLRSKATVATMTPQGMREYLATL